MLQIIALIFIGTAVYAWYRQTRTEECSLCHQETCKLNLTNANLTDPDTGSLIEGRLCNECINNIEDNKYKI